MIYYDINVIIVRYFEKKLRGLSMKKAQSLIEYGLILALVAVVAVAILGKFSKSINDVGEEANTAVSGAAGNALSTYCESIGKTYSAGSGKCN